MLSKLMLAAAVAALLVPAQASAAEYEMVNHADLVFAEHDGTKLVGDLYLPKGRSKAPVLVAVHGGGWQVGDKQFYRYWGLFLARAGYAVFAVDYRLGKRRRLSGGGLRREGGRAVHPRQGRRLRPRSRPHRADRRLRRRPPCRAGRACRRPVQHGISRRRQRRRARQRQVRDRFLRCLRHACAMDARS